MAFRPRRVLGLEHVERGGGQPTDPRDRRHAGPAPALASMTAIPEPEAPPRPGWSLIKRFLMGAALIVVLTAAATATAGLLEISDDVRIFGSGERIPGIGGVLDNVAGGGPQTVLVLGSDRRYADIKAKIPPRSDTILLVRLDPSKEATAVLSIPRDLKVKIPHHRTDKINAAYALARPKLTVQTIKSLFHFPINHVVNVNFGGPPPAGNRLGSSPVRLGPPYIT